MQTSVKSHLAKLFLIRFRHFRPVSVLALGYGTYMLIGALLLCAPFMHEGSGTSFIDNLFVSVSAVSTTGLSPVSTSGAYSWFGEAMILLLIQLGGIGYMTFGSFLYIFGGEAKLPNFRRKVSETTFALTADQRIEAFIEAVVIMTLLIEICGAGLLYPLFQQAGVEHPLWSAIFHSVSAFCTAGFSLFDTSLEAFRDNTGVNIVIAVLSYLGAIGFIVMFDFWRWATDDIEKISLTSKIILAMTAVVFVAGSLLLYIGEPLVTELPFKARVYASMFQCMTAATTVGFNTVPIGDLSAAFAFLLVLIMVIGASPSGTGGGLKSTTVATMLGAIRSAFRGTADVVFWRVRIPGKRVRAAMVTVGAYVIVLLAGTFLLAWAEGRPLDAILFESASALGTVGLSRGITADLTTTGKLIITGLMYVGRVGVLVITFSFLGGATIDEMVTKSIPEEDVAI